MKGAPEGVAMLTISTIAEALAELERQTGRAWTDSELFDVATANAISLHAAPPITASSSIYEFVPGDGLVEKHRMGEGRAALAELFPWQVGQLWISGETKTTHPSDHDRMEGQFHWFTEPVKVTREQVRIYGGTLRQIVDLWRVAQAWDRKQPPLIRPAWMVPPATQQETTRTEPEKAAGQSWKVVKPKHFRGYGQPLYELLAEANRAGNKRPTAADVLTAWRANKPPQVFKVLLDSLEYWSANGEIEEASLDAVRKAIGRMTAK